MAKDIDMTQVMGLVSNMMGKIDMSKLKSANDIDEIKIFYKHNEKEDGNGLLNLNILMKPNSPSFSESFLEILKVVLMASPKLKIEFEQVD